MTFATDETSVADSRVVELYEFIGTTTTYRYTSGPKDVVSNGDTYTALEGLDRSAVAAGTHEEDGAALDVTVPFNNTMASTYVFSTAPPSLELNLYRAHRRDLDDTLLTWKGKVVSSTVEGRLVKLRVPTVFGYLLGNQVPRVLYQGPCNHILYDSFCAVDPTTYESSRTVSSISENVITLDSSPFVDDACNGGEMEFAAGGERRMIVDNVGTAFTINYPFSGLSATDTVIIRQGCDHSFEGDCKVKFSNGANFGGFPLVPTYNIFKKSRL